MKIGAIFWKSLKEQVRDWRTLGLSFAMPVVFMVIFGLAMGGGYYTYKIITDNRDSGPLGREWLQRLQGSLYANGRPVFILQAPGSAASDREKLEKHEVAARLTIPAGFSAALQRPAARPVEVTVTGDPGFPAFSLVKMMVDGELNAFAAAKSGRTPLVGSRLEMLGGGGEGSEFDYIAPGLMLMAIFMLLIQCAVAIVRECEAGTILRLRLMPLRSGEYLAGVGLTQVLFAVLMIPMMFYTAVAVGFHSRGSLLTGMVVGVLASLSAIAVGLITAAVSRTANQAFLIGNMVIIPVVFLSGVFFPAPQITLFHLGRPFGLFDLQPATHAVNAFNRIFLFGAGLGEIGYEIFMMLFLSAVYFLIGVWLFRRTHLRRS